MEAKYSLVLAFLIIGLVTAQNSDKFEDFDQIKDDDEEMLVFNQDKATWKTKCDLNGGPKAFSQAQDAYDIFNTCIDEYLNITELQKQFVAAKPTGQVDEVFKKYCSLSPQFKSCFNDMIKDAKACLTEKEKENLKIVDKIIDQLIEFACHNDGERLALIMAEGGVKCFTSKREQLVDCTERDIGQNYLEFGTKDCSEMLKVQSCVVSVLEKCEKPTIADVVESLMEYIYKSTPCKEFVGSLRSQSDGANGIPVPTSAAVIALLAAILV